MERVLPPLLAMARSSFPSPLKSPRAMPFGELPAVMLVAVMVPSEKALLTSNNARFDLPPPGVALLTWTRAVPAVAMLVAGTVAVSFDPFTNVVARATPFQSTVEPFTKPDPFTVKVNWAPPGAAVIGDSELTYGTGLATPVPVRMMAAGLVALSE